jgi:hypothetical protein
MLEYMKTTNLMICVSAVLLAPTFMESKQKLSIYSLLIH